MELCGTFKDLLTTCITKDLTNNMIEQTKYLAAQQKIQLMQAFQIGDMDKVNNLVKGKGFAKAFKKQCQQALNLATTFNTPNFNFGKFNSMGLDMKNQMKNLTKFKAKSNIMKELNNLRNRTMETDLFIKKLKRQAENLDI